jgi:hypothetical protein
VGLALVGGYLLRDMFGMPRPVLFARWLFKSREYKRRVMAQTPGSKAQLRHVEWDGWGWAGMDTTVYLVFDPDTALDHAATSGLPGKYPGVPCEVYRVRKLEDHWYTVQFYTESSWEHCS